MAAFSAVFTFGGSGPAITAHGSLDQEIQILIQTNMQTATLHQALNMGRVLLPSVI
jgi:hypothetical protein